MKAVVLAAGLGTRLRPITNEIPKAMVKVADKPLIDYSLEKLRDAGIIDVCLVVGYLQEQLEEYVGDGSKWGLNVTYVTQEERLGLAHAVNQAKDFVDDSFIVLLSDNLYANELSDLKSQFEEFGGEAGICVTEVEDPTQFGVVELEGDKIIKMVEKPKEPPTNLAIVGIYFFKSPKLFDIITNLKPSGRGEYEITDAIQGLINQGDEVYAIQMVDWWKDTGTFEDLQEVEKMLKGETETVEEIVEEKTEKAGVEDE